VEPSQARRTGAAHVASIALRALSIAASLAALGASGCAAPTSHGGPAVPAAKPDQEGRPFHLLPPFELATTEDAIVRIVSDVTCTGTLIAEDLVLTAHHCVSARDDSGRTLRRDKDPEDISIELGGDYLPWGEVKIRSIVSPDCGYTSGEGDIAILVLERRLIGISTLTPRLEAEPTRSELVDPVGFGRCGLSADAIHRVRRAGGRIESISASDFIADASICPGDSGGPAFSRERLESFNHDRVRHHGRSYHARIMPSVT